MGRWVFIAGRNKLKLIKMDYDNLSQIIPMHIVQLYWNVKNMQGENGWKADSEIKRIYYREPASLKLSDNYTFSTITYEVVKQFKNKNYIQAAISMEFGIVNFGEAQDSENYRCLVVCAELLQHHVNSITKGHDYLKVDVSINSDTKFEPVSADKLGVSRQN